MHDRRRHLGRQRARGPGPRRAGWLAERGYGDVEAVVAAEESLLFSLPNELRRDLKARKGEDAGTVRHDAAFDRTPSSLH